MLFYTLVVKNLIRRPLRSLLTISAIGVALAATISLVGVSTGFERSYLQIYDRIGVDFVIVKTKTVQRLTSLLDESIGERMLMVPGVEQVIPGLIEVISIHGLPAVVLQGSIPESIVFEHLEFPQGRTLTLDDKRAVIVGSSLAPSLGVKPGDDLEIYEGAPAYKVVGIFKSNNVYEDGMIIMPLSEMQELMGRQGQVTGFSVVTDAKDEPARMEQIKENIEAVDESIACLAAREHVGTLMQVERARGMAWLTSSVALFIGAVGVMNTMVMATYERIREIGIMRAVGWRKGRVMRLLLAESVLLSLIGAAVGSVAALALVKVLTSLPQVRGFISGSIDPWVFAQGFVLALVVGVVGGLVPAYRVATLVPTRALHIE